MKFLQIHTFYPSYLSRFYANRPSLIDGPPDAIEPEMLADGFGAGHMWASFLRKAGHETKLIIANDIIAQGKWAAQNLGKLSLKKKSEWVRKIALEQVNRFDPEVLHLGDPVVFDMDFVRQLKKRPRWVIGWRAAPTPDTVNWSGMDLLLSHLDTCLRFGWKHGVRDARFLYPGFPRLVAAEAGQAEPKHDVVFCGNWTADHAKRNNLIIKVVKASKRKDKPFNLGLYLECHDPSMMPEAVRNLNQGSRWGMEMYRTLRSGRIAINAEIDMGRGNAGNMRLFEATGLGTFLLTENNPNLDRYFTPGKEVETFQKADDLIAKIDSYLADSSARERIAKAGQARCLTEHETGGRVKALEGMLCGSPGGIATTLRSAWKRVTA
ncbi:MAG: hypothetical protein JWO94_1957 [Verrucomicrobiaceae bacterium]|nr:hypothetical protein [Verrucomicrobiaceae bacterium]